MEASKVLKKDVGNDRDDEMHECQQKERISKLESAVQRMAVDIAKLTVNTSWILKLNVFLAGTIAVAVLGELVHLLLK